MAKKDQKQSGERRKDYDKLALALHKKHRGKISVESKVALKTKDDLSVAYTPGVGAVSLAVAKKPADAYTYTSKGNTVAVVSDGSAVLGLGDIGPLGALPVMEGKAILFKERAGIDAFPIVLGVHTVQEIVAAVKAIAPGFGGINLEDIAAPQCFEIEARLKEELDIPVFHDDQHGTAVVVLGGLINASKVVKKNLEGLKVVVVGAGAAGKAITDLLLLAGLTDITVVDRHGAIVKGRKDLRGYKKQLAEKTNPRHSRGELLEVVKGADALIGVSGPGSIAQHHVEVMADKAIVFALANPVPEIQPKDAKRAGAAVIATGRSDYPNQVNNALVFPGLFRGALDKRVRDITDSMKLQAAKKLAGMVKKPTAENIIPTIQEVGLVKKIASAVTKK